VGKRFDYTYKEGDGHMGLKLECEKDMTKVWMPVKLLTIQEAVFPKTVPEWVWEVVNPKYPDWNEADSIISPKCTKKQHHAFRMIAGLMIFITKYLHMCRPMLSHLMLKLHNPSVLDLHAIIWLAAFMINNKVPLTFHEGTQEAQENLSFAGCSDAAYKTHTTTSHSHYGYGVKLVTDLQRGLECRSGMVEVKSVTSKGLVPTSCGSAEVGAMSDGVQNMIYTEAVISTDFGLPIDGRSVLWVDNQGAEDSVARDAPSIKGLRAEVHSINFVRSAISEGLIKVALVPGNQQMADGLTKNLSTIDFGLQRRNGWGRAQR